MGSRYDLCPKCGAVTKDGKCTSCGRLIIGRSSNSTMDKWRQESRSWQNYNKRAHQDHCTDHDGDGNVYLNGKVIRKTSNYRNFEYTNDFSVSDESYKTDDILSYSSQGRTGTSNEYSAERSADVFVENNVGETTTETVSPTRKRKSKFFKIFWIIFILYIIAAEFMAENDKDLGDYIGEFIDNIMYGSDDYYNDDYYDESVEVSLSDDVLPVEYGGNLKEAVLEDYLNGAYMESIPLSATEYTYSQDYYSFCDYINKDAGYDICLGHYYFNNIDYRYDIEYGDLGYPHNVEIWTRYPVIQNSGLANEDEINQLIYERMAECADTYDMIFVEEDEQIGIYDWVYITYMDEDILSLAFYEYWYTAPEIMLDNPSYTGNSSRLSGMTIDMKTGTIIDLESLIDFPEDYADRFMETYKEQAGSPLDYMSVDTIENLINEGNVFAFYTPVGIEVGVGAHDYGSWASCSYKSIKEISGE